MKKIVFSCFVLLLITYSFLYPEITINAAQNGIEIWFLHILPTLLPFSIISALLINSNWLTSFKGNSNLIACLITLSCGFVFGFPIGAKLSADFYKQNILSYRQAIILAITTNNFSPMFVCGFAMPLLFSNQEPLMMTYILLYCVPLALSTICLLLMRNESQNLHKEETSVFKLNMKIIDSSIINGFESLIKICGYIVLFSIIVKLLAQMQIPIVLLQNIEVSNGIHFLSKCNLVDSCKYILVMQTLSFGGLSGIAQTGSILANSGLSMHKYIIGKVALSLLLTLLSVIYVFFIR